MQAKIARNKLLPFVTKPGRYLGHEYNATIKDWDQALVRCALIFPDLYEVGMSHQGLQILYHILNGQERVLAERSYCPDRDMEKLLQERQTPLTSLESDHALADFDIIGITLPYELCYSNIITILSLAGIPLWSKDRDESFPLILGGGSCSMNPEPVADFFDAILLGDGEEALVEITTMVGLAKENKLSRAELLSQLATIQGLYIPSFFQPQYTDQGTIREILTLRSDIPHVQRRILSDLSCTEHLKRPLVPNAKIVHDRLGVEIARGCTRGCRFCQAGIIYRPVRERSPEQVMDIAHSALSDSGFDELALLSLSTGDYSCIEPLLTQLMDNFAADYVSVSMPSMRVGTLTESVMDQIKRVRKTGFTLAPEAGSERLRRFINKGITEEDLLTTCRDAFRLGWKIMKFYFMIGLPTETEEDIDAIVELAKKAKQEGDKDGRGRRQINVSVGTFVPKPHTPFQWAQQITIDESREKIRRIKGALPRSGINLKWHDPEQSFLEGVFSRGDRRLARLLETAWKDGARLDGWSEHFHLSIWRAAGEKCGLPLDTFLRRREPDEVLPWQHLHSGIETTFLQEELAKAHSETYTPDCRYNGCQQCGLCDFKKIRPIVHGRKTGDSDERQALPPAATPAGQTVTPTVTATEENHFKYNVIYSRTGDICFLGHLEFLQLVFRALRRAGITTHFSQGFNPSPKISFGLALPVGTESLAEYFIMDLPAPLKSPEDTVLQLNRQLPPGLTVQSVALHSGKVPQSLQSSYTVTCPRPLSAEELSRIDDFMGRTEFSITRSRKGKKSEFDIRPLVVAISPEAADTLKLELLYTSSLPGVKPVEILTQVLQMDALSAATSKVLKTAWHSIAEDKKTT
ncbi:MAG: TIGR03960 family B12-binding radical SAM protein [Proteobacteria bacterium]|nr:TIGR03960 family B12-binding radical SAM protein [Pseudomonadota bacterium]MBU1648320.1 TIGR03960 family B12-binding radical SAM protein [Pseudomonadota bacterium]MBU1985827.1 TIGR03960 family B12-binding radical SAM protein [Pseudomonadota bacterium]